MIYQHILSSPLWLPVIGFGSFRFADFLSVEFKTKYHKKGEVSDAFV